MRHHIAALVCASLIFCATQAAHAQSPTPAKPSDAKDQANLDAQFQKLEPVLEFLRNRNAKDYAIDTTNGIDEASYVPIGGIDQWVTIRGQNRANPVLLFVHGGPGDTTNPWTFALFAPWEEEFTVVQWDQRGAGRTLAKSGPSIADTLTPDRMAQDGVELAQYLCKHLGKDKIVVAAHSFGTILALQMVEARPDLFYAYVGTGQVADETKNYSAAYDALVKKAVAIGNQRAIDELKSIGPPPYSDGRGYGVQRKWSNRFEGSDEFLPGLIGLTLVAPGGGIEYLNASLESQMLSGEKLFSQTRTQTMKDLGLEFKVPVFFFEGTEDFTTPTALARDYLAALTAPRKEFVPIEGGHFAVFMNSTAFLKELVEKVRPLASQDSNVKAGD
jgi:pimeloyl-ACP methyl ester carboxylesterase